MSCSRKQSCASCVWVSQPVPGSFRLETARAPANMKGKKERRMGMQPTDAAVVVVLQESKRHTRIIVAFNVWQYIVTKHGDWSRQNSISQSSPKGFWERAGAPNWEHQNHTPKESGPIRRNMWTKNKKGQQRAFSHIISQPVVVVNFAISYRFRSANRRKSWSDEVTCKLKLRVICSALMGPLKVWNIQALRKVTFRIQLWNHGGMTLVVSKIWRHDLGGFEDG